MDPLQLVRYFTVSVSVPDGNIDHDIILTPTGDTSTLLVDSIIVANATAENTTFNILFGEVGNPDPLHYIYSATPIVANSSLIINFEKGLALTKTAHRLYGSAGAADMVDMTITGREVLVQDGE